MKGYGPSSYGDGMADVYDEWYTFPPDLDDAVRLLAALAEEGPVLELGVGTGRLAIPLSNEGLTVWGLDSSHAMAQELSRRPGGDRVHVLIGDMGALSPKPPKQFKLAFAAFHTFFQLAEEGSQRRCFERLREWLLPGGRFVIEAFVPTADGEDQSIEVWKVASDRVVLSVSRQNRVSQLVDGQAIEMSEGGIRLRPWRVRYLWPEQLDSLATSAGFQLEERWAGWDRGEFGAESRNQVAVYRRQP